MRYLFTAVLAATLSLFAVAPAQATTTTDKTEIQYVVSPHPDDVYEAWSLVQDSTANYPVFITLTRGESTGYCKGQYATPLTVQYWTTYDRSTVAGCQGARMASLNNWFDDQATSDPNLKDIVHGERTAYGYNMTKYTDTLPASATVDSGEPSVSGMTACSPDWSVSDCSGVNPNVGKPVPYNPADIAHERDVVWYVGADSARVEFNLGDGNLTDDEVRAAIDYVRANRAKYLPLTNEYGVIAASYSNLGQQYSACSDYSHHDHRAVQEVVYADDLIPDDGNNHPQWGVTCGSQTATSGVDPEVARQDAISDKHYTENMSTTTSFFQNRFRWLHGGSVWPSGNEPVNGIIFSKWNYFWRTH